MRYTTHSTVASMVLFLCAFGLSACNEQVHRPPAHDESITPTTVIGYIKQLASEDNVSNIELDLIEWYEAAKAEKAYREDHPDCINDPDIGCKPLNGYYIRNPDNATTQYDISEDVIVLMQTFDPYKFNPNQPITFDELRSALAGEDQEFPERWKYIPFWLVLDEGNAVVALLPRIIEQIPQVRDKILKDKFKLIGAENKTEGWRPMGI